MYLDPWKANKAFYLLGLQPVSLIGNCHRLYLRLRIQHSRSRTDKNLGNTTYGRYLGPTSVVCCIMQHESTLHRGHRSMGCHYLGWRARSQMMVLHGQNSAIVDSIIDRKVSQGHYKEHPDCPDEEDGTMYYVMTDMGRSQLDETEERINVSTDVHLDLGSEALGPCSRMAIAWQPHSWNTYQHDMFTCILSCIDL